MIDPQVIESWKAGIARELAEAERELTEAQRALADAYVALAAAENAQRAAAEFLSGVRQPIPTALSRIMHPILNAANSARGNVARHKQCLSNVGYVIADLSQALAELQRLTQPPEHETESSEVPVEALA